MTEYAVVVQNWEESERGWGTRPDGFTVHLDVEQRHKYVNWYNKAFNNLSYVPDEYTRVDGEPFKVKVSEACYNRIFQATSKKIKGRKANAVHGKKLYLSRATKVLLVKDLNW